MEHLRRTVSLALETVGSGGGALRKQQAAVGASAALVLGVLTWAIRDYRAFLALGPGGLPYNLKGWAIITFAIRPFALSKASATYTGDYPATGAHADIEALPPRKGARAQVGGIAPHRQLSQHAPERMREYLDNLFANAPVQNPAILETRLSLYERHHSALFVAKDLLEREQQKRTQLPESSVIARGELGHPHLDMSIHIYVSPADARQLIEKGWGERHRLAVPNTYKFKNMFHVADSYLLLYGPRDEEEMEVIQTILLNSIRFMTGREDAETPQWRVRV